MAVKCLAACLQLAVNEEEAYLSPTIARKRGGGEEGRRGGEGRREGRGGEGRGEGRGGERGRGEGRREGKRGGEERGEKRDGKRGKAEGKEVPGCWIAVMRRQGGRSNPHRPLTSDDVYPQ